MKKALTWLIFAAALILSLYYGAEKSGFHEDEYYTYFSSNRTAGLFQPDRAYQDRQTVLDEFTVKKGEGFNYPLVALVQSWDVHPPLYYFIFHTACSFVPGVFTKWTGLITNLIAFAIAFLLMVLLLKELKAPDYISWLILIFWAVNPQTISCNMLIRMYGWLTVWVLACALFHVRMINSLRFKKQELKAFVLTSLLPVMAVSYLGFLTQYFYIFFFIPTGFCFAVWLFFLKKEYKKTFVYAGGCALSLALAILTYPSALRHMFGGYRGTGAAGSLLDPGSTVMRLSFFVGLLNDFVFGGGLVVIIFMIMLGVIYKVTFMRNKPDWFRPAPDVVILSLGSLSYFLLTAKSALLVGAASNRYEMPIYPLIILLVFLDMHYIMQRTGNKTLVYMMCAVCLAFLLKGLIYDNRILFLYPEDVEKTEFARENSTETAVVMFNPATPHNVWRLTDELLEYPQVFYMDEENLEPLTESGVVNASRIILYAADDDLQKEAFDNITSSTGLKDMSFVSREDMWTTYVLE